MQSLRLSVILQAHVQILMGKYNNVSYGHEWEILMGNMIMFPMDMNGTYSTQGIFLIGNLFIVSYMALHMPCLYLVFNMKKILLELRICLCMYVCPT